MLRRQPSSSSVIPTHREVEADMVSPQPEEELLDEQSLIDGVEIQYLAVEEEPIITNTYVNAAPDCIQRNV